MKQKLLNNFRLRAMMIVAMLVVSASGRVWGDEASFAPSNFSGQGTSGSGSAISATVDGVTFACNKGYGTTQVRCYSGGKITISSSNTITAISFTFSDSKTGGLNTSYTGLSTTSWEQTLSSQARITAVTVTYSTTATYCATPTFSPEAGSVASGTEVTISTTTEGATIHYTTDGNDPTTESTTYTSAITITEDMTIKAIAVKDGLDNSNIASAEYTVLIPVPGYNIDFESVLQCYTDWTFSNIGLHTTGLTCGSHDDGGSAWGSNVNDGDNGVTTAYIQTKEKVTNPGTFTCYISKESSNTTSSTWYIQYSNDGESWTDAGTASSMTQNSWTEFSADLSGQSDVYVRLYYSGSSAKRAVDDISLTTVTPSVATPTFSPEAGEYNAVQSVTITTATEGATIYYTTDGTDPSNESSVYSEAISVNSTMTIKAIAMKDGMNDSEIATAAYTITLPSAVETPVITPGANPFNFSTTATITCATEGATIYYSYDNENWTEYTAGLNITATTTVSAKATKDTDESNVANLTITKEKVTPTVAVSGDLTVDLNGGSDFSAGTLTAAVTYNEEAVEGAAVTWSSSDIDVATINASTGAVTLLTTGEVTFTATYAGNDDYSEATDTKVVTVINSKAPGTVGCPYTVAQAIEAATGNGFYVTGIISSITEVSTSYGNATYNISDDGTTSSEMLIYRGKYLENANFTSEGQIEVGDKVVVYGNITQYNSVNQFGQGNYLISLKRKALSSIALSGTYTTTFHQGDAFSHDGMVVTANYDNETQADVTESATFSGYDMSTLGEQTVTVSYTENEVEKTTSYTITVSAPAALESIALSGSYTTTFSVGDEFSTEGMVVTATYDDESQKVVTESATFSTPDMSTAGVKAITVTYTENEVEKSTTYDITVNTVAVTGITLDKTSATVNAGETVTLTPTFTPTNATNQNITWTSSDESVATVSNGTVTGVAAGTATITATTEDGNFTATCEVTVSLGATIGLNNSSTGVFYGTDGWTSGKKEASGTTATGIAVDYSYGSGTASYLNDSQIRMYNGSTLKFTAPEGFRLTSIALTITSGSASDLSTNVTTYSNGTWTGSAESVTFTGSDKLYLTTASVTYVDTRHTLTITEPTNGTISVVDANSNEITTGTKVKAGAELTVTATPAAGYAFTTWTGDGFAAATAASTTFTMPASDTTIGATFDEDNTEYTITLNTPSNGTLTSDKASAQSGETITLTTTPAEGYVLKSLTVYDPNTLDEITVENNTFTMPSSNVNVEAIFAKKYTISIDAENGTIAPDVEWAIAGQTVTLTITPSTGYELSDIEAAYGSPSTSVELSGEGNTRTFTMPEANVTVTALFEAAANTINLGTTAIAITQFNNLASGYDNNNGNKAFADASNNEYTWNVDQVIKQDGGLQLQANYGTISAYINSQMGFVLTLAYGANTANVTWNGNTVSADDDDKTTFTINETTGLLTISAGTSYCNITSITLTPKSATFTIAAACTDGEKYYGTYSNTSAFVVPAGLTVSEISVADSKLTVTDYETGDIVPANTGVMVSSTTAGSKSVVLTTAAGTSVLGEDNMLKASGDAGITAEAMAEAAADCLYYRLTMHNGTQIGYYWGAANGAAFALAANKAYLAVPESAGIKEFFTFGGLTDAINGTKAESNDKVIYNLSGQRLQKMQKGINIVNGRKVIAPF